MNILNFVPVLVFLCGPHARHPNPSDDEIERAAQQLAGLIRTAQRHRELAARGLLGWPLMHFEVVLLVAASPVPAVLSAFVARGGVVFDCSAWSSSTRTDARCPDCARARPLNRVDAWRCRACGLYAAHGWMAAVPLERWAPSLLLLAVFVAGAVFALFNVNRGVQDRIAQPRSFPR